MRRFLVTTLTGIGLLILAFSAFSPQARASAQNRSPDINVDGTQPWTNSWIPIFQGSSVSVTANGLVYMSPGSQGETPDGHSDCTADASYVAPGLHCWSLIGKIGVSGTPFQLGSSVRFTAPATGLLYLGVNDNDFSDNSGSWQVNLGTIEAQQSVWAGYSVAFPNPQPSQTLSVQGSWQVPAITCRDNHGNPINNRMSTWLGLGGIDASLEQIGTFGKCDSTNPGKPVYQAFLRTPDLPPGVIEIDLDSTKYPVSPGDTIRADVTDQGYGYYVLRIFDDTQTPNWYYPYIDTSSQSNIPDSAEWITEDEAGGTFPQFYRVLFTNCHSNGNPIDNSLGLTRDTIVRNDGVVRATTVDIFPNGTDFATYWNNF